MIINREESGKKGGVQVKKFIKVKDLCIVHKLFINYQTKFSGLYFLIRSLVSTISVLTSGSSFETLVCSQSKTPTPFPRYLFTSLTGFKGGSTNTRRRLGFSSETKVGCTVVLILLQNEQERFQTYKVPRLVLCHNKTIVELVPSNTNYIVKGKFLPFKNFRPSIF